MLFLLIGAILFFFLCLGAFTFLLLVSLSYFRPHALSAALWWAVCGPCAVGGALLAGLGAYAAQWATVHSQGTYFSLPSLPHGIALFFLIVGIVGTVLTASLAAWIHQVLIRRMTFALFRIYAGVVCAGIGSVFGWLFAFWLQGYGAWWIALAGQMLMFLSVFGYLGFRGAKQLRGHAPKNLTWITPEEFEGVSSETRIPVGNDNV